MDVSINTIQKKISVKLSICADFKEFFKFCLLPFLENENVQLI